MPDINWSLIISWLEGPIITTGSFRVKPENPYVLCWRIDTKPWLTRLWSYLLYLHQEQRRPSQAAPAPAVTANLYICCHWMGATQLRGCPRGINIPRLAVRAVGEGSRSLWGVIHGSVLFQQHLYESVRTIQSWAGSQHKEVSEATVENSWSLCLLEEGGDEATWGTDGAALENADFTSDLLSLGPGQQGLPTLFRVFVTPSPSKRPVS